MKKTLTQLLFLFAIFVVSFSCQKNSIDNDLQGGKLTSSDSIIFYQLLDSLKNNYNNSNEKLIIFSDKIASNSPISLEESYIKIAHIHYSKENYYLAKYYFLKAAKVYEQKQMMPEYAEQISNIGVVLEVSGLYPEALKKYLEALKIFEQLNLKLKIARVSNNIGIVYQQLNEGNKSASYYKRALKIAQKLKNDKVSANSYNNIATYFEEFKQDYDSALLYYNYARNIYLKEPVNSRILTIEANIGNNYLLKNELSKADSVLKLILQKSINNGFGNRIGFVLATQSVLFNKQKKYNDAIEKANKAFELSVKNGNKELQLKSLISIADAYKATGNYKKYSESLIKKYALKEEISGLEQKKQINSLNLRYGVDKMESENKILKLNNDVNSQEIVKLWLVLIIIVLFSGASFFVFNLQRKNNKLINAKMRREIADYINKINQFENEKKTTKELLSHKKDEQILEKTKRFDFTDRENDILLLIAKGYTNTKIAETLFISINTVKFHTKNIFIKLDVKNRIEAVSKASSLF